MDRQLMFDKDDSRGSFFANINEKIISRIHKQAKKQNSVSGAWSDEENLIYAQFIQDHPYEFETAEKRRRFKVFQRMAMHLPNRTAIQCRSHNQKIVKLAGSILMVPRYIKSRMFPRGNKFQMPIQIKEEDNSAEYIKNMEKQGITRFINEQVQLKKQPSFQKRFELPLKLCIQIRNQNIADY